MAAGVLLVAGVVALAITAASVLALVFIALLIAAGVGPVTDRMRNRLPTGRAGTILLIYAGLFALIVVTALFVLPVLGEEAGRVVAKLPSTFADAEAWAAQLKPDVLSTAVQALVGAGQHALSAFSTSTTDAEAVIQFGIVAGEAVIAVATVLALAFFWMLERARLQRYVMAFVSEPRRAPLRERWNAAEVRLGQWVRGQLILMGSIGVAAGIAYSLLGVPSALLLALVAGILEVIPILGPILGAIPALLVAATVSPELAGLVALVYLGLQIAEGYILVPIVMRNAVGLSPFLILFSVLVGAAAGGIVGALLAVPVAATLEIVLERFQEREEPIAIDPTAARGEVESENLESDDAVPLEASA